MVLLTNEVVDPSPADPQKTAPRAAIDGNADQVGPGYGRTSSGHEPAAPAMGDPLTA